MAHQLSEIANIIGADFSSQNNQVITSLLTDSRSLTDASQTLFFALSTQQNDGHRFIERLYKAGVRAFVVKSDMVAGLSAAMPDAVFLGVPDTLTALQTLAAAHRARFAMPVVGITGSRGKTVVKEWLNHVLRADRQLVRSPRSYNSQIGVPLSVWNISDRHGAAVFEAGISQPGEMERLRGIIRPTVGIFTNLGNEHSDGFESEEQKCREKMQLFVGCENVVFCADSSLIAEEARQMLAESCLRGWSLHDGENAWLRFSVYPVGNGSTMISWNQDGTAHQVTIPFAGDEAVENACHVIAASLLLNVPAGTIAERMATLPEVDTRLSVIEAVNHCMLITDIGVTADPLWLGASLDFMHRRATPGSSLTVVLIDPDTDCGTQLADMLASRGVTRLIVVSESQAGNICNDTRLRTEHFCTMSEMLASLSPSDFDNELILISSPRRSSAEAVVEMLEVRRHETVLEVNLDSLVHNFNLIRSLVKPTTGIVAMVKADGYGAGSYELAKTLQAQGASYLAVAVADEGVELRNRGVTMPIMVLNPKVTNYRTLFRYRLEPEIYSFSMLDEIIEQARRCGISDFPVHVKIDTGMHRLGFLLEDMPRLVDTLKAQSAVTPCSVFSHLATADCPDMDDYTFSQFDYFDACCRELQSGFPHHIMRHILNSVGIVRFPDHQFDMVRLGICLYGITPLNLPELEALKPVSTLRTVIISIKEWPAGTTIGYSRRGVLTRPSRIATIPVGYADGLNRHLGCGCASVWINGCRCPIVGSICMDVCMVDVTGCDCSVGDAVEIFGPHVTADELAEKLGTIPYEVLTSVSQRVKRIYFRE